MNKPVIMLLVLTALVASSCTHYYYMAPTKNVPLFKKEGDININITNSMQSYSEGIEFQGAYALTNKYAIMANYMYAEGGNKSSHNWGVGQSFDIGFGYYKPFWKYGVFEVFTGLGTSEQKHLYDLYSSNYANTLEKASSSLGFNKFFVQPSLGFKGRIAEIAFTSGFSNLYYYKVSHNVDVSENEYNRIQHIADNRNVLVIEPAVTFRLGWKFAKLQLQMTGAEVIGGESMFVDPLTLSIGLNFAISPKSRVF